VPPERLNAWGERGASAHTFVQPPFLFEQSAQLRQHTNRMDIDHLNETHWKRNGENSVYIKLMGVGGYGDIHKVLHQNTSRMNLSEF
jgi:hypothetical protein